MMNRKKRIEKILNSNFQQWLIEVVDISSKHSGHNNFTGKEETHFSIILKQSTKNNLKKIEVHRRINFLLKEELNNGLHALEIKIIN